MRVFIKKWFVCKWREFFFLVEKSCLSWDETRTRYFYRFVILYVVKVLPRYWKTALSKKFNTDLYIVVVMFVSRLFSRALWSPLFFSLLPFSYPLSLSLSLSRFCYCCCCEREEQESSFREKSSKSEFEATNTLLRISLLLTKSVSDSSFSLSLSLHPLYNHPL